LNKMAKVSQNFQIIKTCYFLIHFIHFWAKIDQKNSGKINLKIVFYPF